MTYYPNDSLTSSSSNAIEVNYTAIDESKIMHAQILYQALFGDETFYCSENQVEKSLCYSIIEKCRNIYPTRDPICSPPSHVTANATSKIDKRLL